MEIEQTKAPTINFQPVGKFPRSLSLLAWAYNEEILIGDFLKRAASELDAAVEDWEIVIVNDGSTDSTGRIIDEAAARDSRIRPVHNERNLNVGGACRRAVAAASKEYLCWQTVDWSYDLSNLRIFLELLNHYDVVQGVRPTPIRLFSYIPIIRSVYRVKTRSDNIRKAVVSLGNYYLLRILFGVRFQDFQNVTFYPTKLLQSVPLAGNSSFINPECLLRTYQRGARYIEVPIRFIPRVAGVAKGTKLSSIIRSVRDIFSAWMEWGRAFRADSRTEASSGRIDRVAEPFSLKPEVAHLIVPLLAKYL